MTLHSFLTRPLRRMSTKGATLVEYGVLVGLVSAVAIGGTFALGRSNSQTFQSAHSGMASGIAEAQAQSQSQAQPVQAPDLCTWTETYGSHIPTYSSQESRLLVESRGFGTGGANPKVHTIDVMAAEFMSQIMIIRAFGTLEGEVCGTSGEHEFRYQEQVINPDTGEMEYYPSQDVWNSGWGWQTRTVTARSSNIPEGDAM